MIRRWYMEIRQLTDPKKAPFWGGKRGCTLVLDLQTTDSSYGFDWPKHFSIDAFADMPIHQRQFSIDIDGDAVARLVDYLPQVINQRHNIVVLYRYAVCH